MSVILLSKLAEFAPGLPVKGKITPLPTVKKPEVWQLSAHPHEAERAGEHIDLRLGNPSSGIAHSFVLPKAQMPEPGQFKQVVPTSDHTMQYMDWTGTIQAGYGKGKVKPGRRTLAEVYHADPSDEPGTKLRFNLYDTQRPEEYAVRKDAQGRWFIHNKTQTRERRPDIPSSKDSYKEIPVDKVDPANKQQAMMPKLDGAHTVIDLRAGRAPRVFSYRVGKKTGTGLIEHTHKLPELLTTKVPKELDGTVLRAEVVGLKTKTAADTIPATQLSGMLNAKVWASRKKQQESGVQLKAFPFNVVKYRGKDMTNAPFEEKYKVLQQVAKALPQLQPAPMVTGAKEKAQLLEAVKNKTHPLTEEGVVLVDRTQPGVPIKAKFAPDHDVFVRKIHPAVSKSGDPHDRAGAVSYSRTPRGPIVGRVGGFKHQEARDMLANPQKYVGRAAKVVAPREFPSGTLFQPRFKEWHMDKGDIEKLATYQGFHDELQKIARSYMKDFMAGVDPTGTKTFEYSVADAPKTDRQAQLRKATGVAGGLLGGAVAVPSAIYGIIGGAKGFATGGLRGAARGALSGLAKPIASPVRAFRAKGVMRGLAQGQQMGAREAKIMASAAKELPAAEKYVQLAKTNPGQAAKMLQHMPKPMQADVRTGLKENLAEGLAALGLSGGIGGGSAYLQYGKGREVGQVMTPEQRQRVLGYNPRTA